MSITSDNIQEKNIKDNEEAQVLRNIFDIVEGKKQSNSMKNKNNSLLEKYKIKNMKIEKLVGIEENPKNRYKMKLQKILFNKKTEKKIQ